MKLNREKLQKALNAQCQCCVAEGKTEHAPTLCQGEVEVHWGMTERLISFFIDADAEEKTYSEYPAFYEERFGRQFPGEEAKIVFNLLNDFEYIHPTDTHIGVCKNFIAEVAAQ